LDNLVNIIRIASNRKVYNSYKGEVSTGKGHPKWYGNVFKLNNPDTHTTADETTQFDDTFKNGRKVKVSIRKWKNMLLRGKKDKDLHNKQFHLVSIQVTDNQTGNPIFKETLWLTVFGKRRNEISLPEIYKSYRLRFDIEFFFRFGKQKLLLNKFQTPDLEHQQNWFHIVMLSYWTLYLGGNQGDNFIKKWEKYLPQNKDQNVKEPKCDTCKTPTQAQRALFGIILEFAKTTLMPKTRNKSSGRQKGQKQTQRKRFKVLKKGHKNKK
jgi:hypothetical protein